MAVIPDAFSFTGDQVLSVLPPKYFSYSSHRLHFCGHSLNFSFQPSNCPPYPSIPLPPPQKCDTSNIWLGHPYYTNTTNFSPLPKESSPNSVHINQNRTIFCASVSPCTLHFIQTFFFSCTSCQNPQRNFLHGDTCPLCQVKLITMIILHLSLRLYLIYLSLWPSQLTVNWRTEPWSFLHSPTYHTALSHHSA